VADRNVMAVAWPAWCIGGFPMRPLERLFYRFGYVKLTDYGLRLTPEGRIVRMDGGVLETGLDSYGAKGPVITPASRPSTASAVATAHGLATCTHGTAASRPMPAKAQNVQDDDEEWEWEITLARARTFGEDSEETDWRIAIERAHTAVSRVEATPPPAPPPVFSRVEATPPPAPPPASSRVEMAPPPPRLPTGIVPQPVPALPRLSRSVAQGAAVPVTTRPRTSPSPKMVLPRITTRIPTPVSERRPEPVAPSPPRLDLQGTRAANDSAEPRPQALTRVA